MHSNEKKKLILAVVAGGYSGEYPVSIKSANSIMSWLDRTHFNPYLVVVKKDESIVYADDQVCVPLNYADFSFMSPEGIKVKFDYAFVTIHGTPGEDGIFQGYLDLMGVPYNTGGVLVESLTFDKYTCNRYLSSFPDIRVANSVRLVKQQASFKCDEIVNSLGLPVFVKPNAGGSSIATTRVDSIDGLNASIEEGFKEADTVMVESLIKGVEVTCGCYAKPTGEVVPLPVTGVISHNAFFDYDAKYNGSVEEITPAPIPEKQYKLIQELTAKIYGYLNTQGIIRVDYIIEEDGMPTLLEVNTTPGMTATSFIPQQVAAAGLNMKDFLSEIICATFKK